MNSSKKEWKFFKYEDKEPRRDSSSDKHFKDLNKNESLIRELIQNSLDAVENKKKPVTIKIGFKELEFADCEKYFEDLEPHYDACEYKNQDFPKKNQKVKFLVLEDFNTTGLEKKKIEDFFSKII